MYLKNSGRVYLMIAALTLIFVSPLLFEHSFTAYAQRSRGNSVSGNVFGINRRPLPEMIVELMDEFHRTIGRTRTNGSGYYEFTGFGQGTHYIRVYALGTEYEEQEQEIEIQNTLRQDGSTGGFSDELKDFYMKLRPGVNPASVAIFVQPDVPPEAEKLYKKAINDLDAKRETEGLAGLRQAIEKFPRYYYALERLGNEYIRMGRPETFEAAEILLASAVEINTRGFKSWYGLAYARYAQGKMEGAAQAIQKALEVNSFSPDAHLLSGVILRRSKNFVEAEKHLLKAREIAKDSMPQVHKELAYLYGTDFKRYADAAKEFKLYLKAVPNAKDADSVKKMIAEMEEKAKTGN